MSAPASSYVGMADRPAHAGGPAAPFVLDAFDGSTGQRLQIRLDDYLGSWLVLLFCPSEMIFGCGAELGSISTRLADFELRGAEVLAVGREPLHRYEGRFGRAGTGREDRALRFPIASDATGTAARAYGVAKPTPPYLQRALFVIDPASFVQYQVVHDLCVGRSTDEMLRIVDALQVGGMCALQQAAREGRDASALRLGPDQVLGHYRIEEKLGQGGFGQVFRGWDRKLHRPVALKLIHPGSQAGLDRILAEARSAARLNHPNVCTVYSVEEHGGQPLIAMEYLAGQSLSQRLRSGGALGIAEARRIVVQVALAIDAAHRHELVHADLKPGNIMLSEGGLVKVLDFGLASHSGEPTIEAPLRSESGDGRRLIHFRGTPPYMSPEQANGEPVLPASDVFTLGLVMHEMFTCARANPARTVRSAVRHVRTADPFDLAAPLPAPFRELVADCLSLRPDRRPTMAAVAARLGTEVPAVP